MGKKIGLLLANVYQGSSRAMWRYAAAMSAKHPEDALIIFPGGRLGFIGASEYLRNGIYDLAGNLSIDGALIWSSSLTGAEGAESITSFVKGIADHLPVVSMCMPIPGIPSVDFDAYTGTYRAVMHFIKAHGARKIAFIRGPENHKSAEARYQAYKDALSDFSIKLDERLVTSPRSWSDGKAAALELLNERKLVAGKDFDAVVAASDLLVLGVEKAFRQEGISIPEDIGISGFNDNEDNQLLDVELTTVRMPIRKILETAYSVLLDLKEGNTSVVPSVLLPSEFIIRHSCGCRDGLGGIENARETLKDDESLMDWLYRYLEDGEACKAVKVMLDYVFSLPVDDQSAVKVAVTRYFDSGAEASTVIDCLRWSEDVLGKTEKSPGRRDYLVSCIAHGSRRLYAGVQQRLGEEARILDTFKTSLLAARSYSSLPMIMHTSFPLLGISGALLMLYEDFQYTKMLGGFSGEKIYSDNLRFPRNRMVPEFLSAFIDKGTFVIEPLYYEKQELGYIILATEWCESHVLEDIRASLSSAIKGISLTEVAQKSAEAAEEEERKAREFYASVSEALRGPLSVMHRMLTSGEGLPKEAMAEEVRKAEQMLSLSLAEFGNLDIEKSLIPLSIFIKQLSSSFTIEWSDSVFPAIEMDPDSIEELLAMIFAIISPYGSFIRISLSRAGVVFKIKGHADDLTKNPAWQVASRIAVLNSGELSSSEDSISFVIPYPTLSGHANSSDPSGPVVWLSDKEVPSSLLPLSPVILKEEDVAEIYKMNPRPAAIAWIRERKTRSGNAVLRLLRSHKVSRSIPFIVYGIDEKAASLSVALESGQEASEDTVIYMTPRFRSLYQVLSDFGRVEEGIAPEEMMTRNDGKVRFVVLSTANHDIVSTLRRSKRFSSVPLLIVKDIFTDDEIGGICDIPNVLIVNTTVLEAPAFVERLVSILTGGEILPPLTGALVKKAIAYLNRHLSKQISRWQLAESVNISEDYLTRIFRREMGVSPWDYLTRCRVGIASDLLLRTGAALSEIAIASGFQDQAYFCRVFRRIKGCSPGQFRQRDSENI